MSPEQFTKMLRQSNASVSSLRDQIKARLSWTKAFSNELRGRITISNTDIDAFIQRIKNNLGKTEYLLAEIFLPVDDPKQDRNVKQLAYKIVSDIAENRRLSLPWPVSYPRHLALNKAA